MKMEGLHNFIKLDLTTKPVMETEKIETVAERSIYELPEKKVDDDSQMKIQQLREILWKHTQNSNIIGNWFQVRS
jgi:hypothetical protein